MSRVIATIDLPAIRSAWEAVFRSNDPFSWPFHESVEIGRMFYPTDYYHLTKKQYSAVVSAAKAIDEASFFLSIVESEGLSFLNGIPETNVFLNDRPLEFGFELLDFVGANLPAAVHDFPQGSLHHHRPLVGGDRRPNIADAVEHE